jgi:hypothetical protein
MRRSALVSNGCSADVAATRSGACRSITATQAACLHVPPSALRCQCRFHAEAALRRARTPDRSTSPDRKREPSQPGSSNEAEHHA